MRSRTWDTKIATPGAQVRPHRQAGDPAEEFTAGAGVQTAGAKPLLRGWLHLGMVPVALVAGLALIVTTSSTGWRAAEAVYLVTGLMLFGNSAAYHRGTWGPALETLLRRFDHSNIAIFIAGTYTALAVPLLHGGSRVTLLTLIWACCLAEVLLRNLWMGAPRWLYTVLYIAMGWAAVFWLPQFWTAGGPVVVLWMVLGGLAYTAGAICYAAKRPNPNPRWFGFHEIFHSGTILGAASHFLAIWIAAH